MSKRDALERELAKLMGKSLAEQLLRIQDIVSLRMELENEFWVLEDEQLQGIMTMPLTEIAQLGADNAAELLKVAVDIGFINAEALGWAREYSFELVKGINNTSRQVIEDGLTYFIETPGATLQDFVDLVSPTFGSVRAEKIAITETTRAYAEGGDIAVRDIRDQGMEIIEIWQSQNAPNTCDECLARHGKRRGTNWQDLPPAHVGCNCWVTYEIM